MDIKHLVDTGQELQFYVSATWKRKRAEVLALDKHECQICRQRGTYTRAVIVHHVKHLRDRPDLALCVSDPDTGERQLVSLCRACHEEQHPERLRMHQFKTSKKPITEERW